MLERMLGSMLEVVKVDPAAELAAARAAEGILVRAGEPAPVECPQLAQNLAPATTGLPHWEQNATLDLTLWV